MIQNRVDNMCKIFSFKLKTTCPYCKKEIGVDLSSVNFDEVETEEKSMGEEKGYEAEPDSVVCPSCGERFKKVLVYEYPEGRYNAILE